VKARSRRLKTLFNITEEEYQKVLKFQGGVCPITLKPPKPGQSLHVDHNHQTGLVRGGLTWQANKAIGHFRDDPDMLERAADYLRNPPVTQALGETVYGVQGRVTTKAARRKYGPNGTKHPHPRKDGS
jgi:hypothetical protein